MQESSNRAFYCWQSGTVRPYDATLGGPCPKYERSQLMRLRKIMESRPTPNASAFWGQYSDLYHTLEASEVDLLEKAIFARRLGRFEEAWVLHNHKLHQARLIPVLALEKANLASRLGLAGDQYAIFKEALNSSTEWRQSSSQRETMLLEISVVEAKFQWTGGTRAALHEARTLRAISGLGGLGQMD